MIDWYSICDATRSNLATPFLYKGKDAVWTCASNGQAILLVRGEIKGAKQIGPNVAYALRGCADVTHRASWHDVAGWAREADVAVIPCTWCDGSGADDDGDQCFECDGARWEHQHDWHDVYGASIDRVLLWRYLRNVYAPTVRVVLPTCDTWHNATPMGLFAGDDSWRLYVMPGASCDDVGALPRGILEASP